MSYVTGRRPKFDMSRVIERAFGALAANFVTLCVSAFLFVFLPQAALGYFQTRFMTELVEGGDAFAGSSVDLTALVGAFFLGVVLNAVMQGVATHATVSGLQDRKVGLGQSLAAGVSAVLPLIGVAILYGLGVLAGTIALIVPGVILALMWCVSAPAVVIEKKGVFAALGRSRDLTRNHRGVILGLVVIYWVAAIAFGMLLGVFFVAAAGAFQPENALLFNNAVVNPLVTSLSTMLSACGVAAIYVELRTLKEGAGTGREEIAALFD